MARPAGNAQQQKFQRICQAHRARLVSCSFTYKRQQLPGGSYAAGFYSVDFVDRHGTRHSVQLLNIDAEKELQQALQRPQAPENSLLFAL